MVGILNSEIGSGRIDTGRLGAPITAAQYQGCSKDKNEDVITHTDIINNCAARFAALLFLFVF